jgi:hypothetical protein
MRTSKLEAAEVFDLAGSTMLALDVSWLHEMAGYRFC